MIVKRVGSVAYDPLRGDACVHRGEMARHDDEIWLCEHPPVFTQGVAGRAEHVREPGAIPILQADRGGQVTYHGPGRWSPIR